MTFQNYLKENKIKFIPLRVSAPFHCSLMQPAAEVMKSIIDKINFKSPSTNIINNVTAEKSPILKKLRNYYSNKFILL